MAKTEISRIIEQFKFAYEGPAWHGPAILEIISKISLKDATKQLGESHNIAETVYHMIAWRLYLIKHLQGDPIYDVDDEDNFTKMNTLSEKEWEALKSNLDKSQKELSDLLALQTDELLSKKVENRKFNYYKLIHGVIQHDLYHLGQIKLLINYA